MEGRERSKKTKFSESLPSYFRRVEKRGRKVEKCRMGEVEGKTLRAPA
jgi:hypothetical protein